MDDLKDILSHSNKDIDNQKLLDYISQHLSESERHQLEKDMIDSDFISDAVEGLEQFHNKKDILNFVSQLNSNLKVQLEKKKRKKEKRKLKDQPWITTAVIIVLLLCILGFIIIKKILHN